MANNQARTEFASAINQICAERGIEPEVVFETIKSALLAAYRKEYDIEPNIENEETERIDDGYEVTLDPDTGEARIFKTTEDKKKKDITPPEFGRIATQTAKQVILQRVREAEKDAIIEEYKDKVNTMITGMVLRFDGKNVIYDIGRGQAYMPPEDQIPTEFYKMNQRMAVFIKDIRETMRGKTIIVSRSTSELVEELFKREVPEVSSGAVIIKAISREAGLRTKIAVDSTQEGVDPVGSCVGQKGVRVQEVINELNNEKIDIIQYSDDPKMFIASALAPAEHLSVVTNDKKRSAVVTIPDDQLSLAIGKGGQNVRLAAKLTGYKIDIKGATNKTTVSASGEAEFEIDELALDEDVRNTLIGAKITTFEAVFNKKDQLADLEGIDEKVIEDIIDKIKAFNLSLDKIIQSLEKPDKKIKTEEKPTKETSDKPKKETKKARAVDEPKTTDNSLEEGKEAEAKTEDKEEKTAEKVEKAEATEEVKEKE
jgi:N utilization substance protein A